MYLCSQMKKLSLKKGKEASIFRRHPWVFSGALKNHAEQNIEPGNLVGLYSHLGDFLGQGFYDLGSIALKMISFRQVEINEDFFFERLQSALSLRQMHGLIQKNNNIFRLCHGEGDYLPGLIMDVYDDTVVVQAHSRWVHQYLEVLVSCLKKLHYPVNHVYFKSELNGEGGYKLGGTDEIVATENGIEYCIDPGGQKTGFFIDQRDNRKLLTEYVAQKRVLNLYSFSGGFSLAALKNHASEVISVDSSKHAIDLLEKNLLINKNRSSHTSVCQDVKKYLKENSQRYDVIVNDPPAFAKSLRARHNALQAYKRMNTLCMKKIADEGGFLFTFSCSAVMTDELFEGAIRAAAIDSGREIQKLKKLGQGTDHPVNIFHPEGHYLKGLLLFVR